MENGVMVKSEARRDGGQRLLIAGPMTLSTAAHWRERLLAVDDAQGDMELDLSGVSDIDAAAIQLLVRLRQQARGASRRLRLLAPSTCVHEALDFCHLSEFFEIPRAARP